jgi:phospho-N-acetylmuramoyl-pentapeptide-transferase
MLFHLLAPLETQISVMRVFGYITFRTAAASLTALALSLLLGPWLIRRLREFQIGQVIRTEGPASHKPKAGTPTMGGLLILAAVFVPTLLWADLRNPFIWIAVTATAAFGAIGFLDDYLKVTRNSHHGLFARYKFGAQMLVGIGVGLALLYLADLNPAPYNTRLIFPFFKGIIPDLGGWYVLFAMFVLLSTSNTVNLTDGLDGLAISTFAVAAASLGFLWWNAHPADIFMGDVGSLALGGALGTVAILIKQELLLPIVGGVFVLEGLSVIIQVASFKLTGKRVFRMSPLHHHFEIIGWAEPKIITRFLILAIIFALLSLTTLKLR